MQVQRLYAIVSLLTSVMDMLSTNDLDRVLEIWTSLLSLQHLFFFCYHLEHFDPL